MKSIGTSIIRTAILIRLNGLLGLEVGFKFRLVTVPGILTVGPMLILLQRLNLETIIPSLCTPASSTLSYGPEEASILGSWSG